MSFQIVTVGHDLVDADHTHHQPDRCPHWLAGYLVRGNSQFTTNGRTIIYKPGWFCLLPPYTPYDVAFGGGELPWTSYWMFFDHEGEDELLSVCCTDAEHLGVNLRGLFCEDDVRIGFQQARQWVIDGHPQAFRLATNVLERSLLLVGDIVQARSSKRSGDERVKEIKRFLTDHLAASHTVASCARRVHLSPARFAALFRKEVGTTPMRYLERLRLCRAQELLLRTSMSVGEIANTLGFENQHHFSTRFRMHTGQSPRIYRQTTTSE